MAERCEAPVGSSEEGAIRPSEDTATRPATAGQRPARRHRRGTPSRGSWRQSRTRPHSTEKRGIAGLGEKTRVPLGLLTSGPPRAPATAGPGLQFRGPARDREVHSQIFQEIWDRGWMHTWDPVAGGCFVTCDGASGAEKRVKIDLGRKWRRPARGPHGTRLT